MGIFVPVVVDGDHWDAETTSKRVVFIRVGRLCRRVHWTTGTMRDLQVLVCRQFGAPEDLVRVRAKQNDANPFILFHSESSKGHVEAAPLVWPDADLRNGSVVSVRDPLWQAVLTLCAGEGDTERNRRRAARVDQNTLNPKPPLTPTPAPFPKAAGASGSRAVSAESASESDAGSAARDGESDVSAGARISRRGEPAGSKLARYVMPLSEALSSAQFGALSFGAKSERRVHVARGDLPRRLAKKLAQRASVLSNLDDLTTRERVHVLMNDPGSSPSAAIIGGVTVTLIGVSTVTFCVETLPWLYASEPSFADPLWGVEAFCVATFTAEFSLRAWATDDRRGFFRRVMNVVDLAAIVPFYVDLLARGLAIPGLTVLRILRLARVFRLLRVSKTAVDLLGQTMVRSARPLYILSFLLVISLITFAALLYFAERGTYDITLGLWMRTLGFECAFPCVAETLDFTPGFLACSDGSVAGDEDSANAASAYFDRLSPSAPAVAATCERVVEQSPFQSIPHAIWWAVATMGTVGYGDITPRTLPGWILASLAQLMGILVIALPITVIGSNFSVIYSSVGTSRSLSAKEHEPSMVAKPPRLHASGSGATAAKLTDGGMVGPLQHEWDLDVSFDELLPCAAPGLVTGAEDGNGERLRDSQDARVLPMLGRAGSWTKVRRDLTPEEQIEAFIKGEDLLENPRSAENFKGFGSGGRLSAPAGAGVDAGDGTRKDSLRSDAQSKSRLGVHDLVSALLDAKDRGVRTKAESVSVSDRPRFAPPKVSRKSGRARRAALCALAEAFLEDCVRNVEMRDKFAATRQRESLSKGDSLFPGGGVAAPGAKKSGLDSGPESKPGAGSHVKRSAGTLSGALRQRILRSLRTPRPTSGSSIASPRTVEVA